MILPTSNLILENEWRINLSELDARLIVQIQENYISYFRLFAGQPGITFVEEDVTWFCNAGPGEPGSYILRAHLPADTADREIDCLLERIGRQTNHIDWMLFPGSLPTDLGKRLERRGMVGHPAGTWMTADLTRLPSAPPVPVGFTVQPVRDDAMLAVWKQAQDTGFGGDAQLFHDAYARHGYGPEAIALHYVGFQDDQPVTSGTLLLSDGIASIYNISTPPALRRRGYGSAITAYTMREAIQRRYRLAWIWSSDDGKSVYSKLGFVAKDFGIREYPWHKSPASQ
jgi:ribosomal protein S18 acetylase RimI-like enzyme